MKTKKISNLLVWGLLCGFLYGLITGILLVNTHQYTSQNLQRLAYYTFAEQLNRGILTGAAAVSALVLLVLISRLFNRIIIFPLFEIKAEKKRKLLPVFKTICFVLVIGWGLYVFLRSVLFEVEFGFILSGFIIELILISVFYTIPRIKRIHVQKLLGGPTYRLRLKMIVVFLAIAAVVNLGAIALKTFIIPKHPNILLILPDTLRADHLGCYGYERPTSPNMDRFAEECLVFEQALSNAPWTKPSTGSILTALYPHEHQGFRWMDNLSSASATLAEVLRNKNYRTFAIQANVILTRRYNFQQGFQTYKERISAPAEQVTDEFLDWMVKNKKRPFFAYLHYMDTHYPYPVPEGEFRPFGNEEDSPLDLTKLRSQDIRILDEMGMPRDDKNYIVNMYDNSIRYFDDSFGRIIKTLNDEDILENTIVILLSDHGEEFWRHQSFGHGHTLYNEVLHVPLMIRYPRALPAKRFNFTTQLLDLFPTVLELSGIKHKLELRGENLLPAVLNDRDPDSIIFFEGLLRGGEKKGVLRSGWKLIHSSEKRYNRTFFEPLGKLTKYKYPRPDNEYELYNLDKDSAEQFDLVTQQKDILRRWKHMLFTFNMDDILLLKQKEEQLEKKLEDFRALGYIK